MTNVLSRHHNLMSVHHVILKAWSVYHVILKALQDVKGSYLRVLVDMFSAVPDESYSLHAGVRK